MRKCGSCNKMKHSTAFHKSANRKDGINTVCKMCRNLINVLYRLRRKNKRSKYNLPLNMLPYDFKQFLFFLTFPENKERVYQEAKSNLSFSEEMLLFRMNRDYETEWRKAA
jgi:hypothetical protein